MVQNNTTAGRNYKFRAIKVHGTNEWLLGTSKKYRQVFDALTTKFIYVELSLYNLKFDESDWQISVNFKAYDMNNLSLCDKTVTQTVASTEDVAFIRYSWGKETPGAYWTKGSYRWEAWVDGVMIGSANFYMIGEGNVTEESNPYFSLSSIKLYEGPFEDIPFGQRNYLKVF
ncbi:MAG: AAA family ATPase, partial [Ignavibacteria bacterium]|nr:AAA family ATPase [Ignavibacteria bacterium]